MKEERKMYKMIPGQAGVVLSLQYAIKKEVVNIPLSAFVEGKLDLDLLEKAVNLAVERNDMFGLRLQNVGGIAGIGGEIMQYFDKREIIGPDRLDFTGKTDKQMKETFEKLAKKPIRHFNAPLGRVSICTAPNGDCGLYIVFSHIMADTWGCYVFFNDVFAVYRALSTGSELPKAPASFETCIQEELKLAESDKAKMDMAFWYNEYVGKSEPMFTTLQGSEVLDAQNAGRKEPKRTVNGLAVDNACEIVSRLIPGDKVKKYIAYCSDNNLSLQALYLSALRTYLSKTNKRVEDISILTVLNHRAKLIDKRSGGCRVHYYPLRTIVEEDKTFWELCDIVNDRLTTVYRHSDANPIHVFGQTMKILGAGMRETYYGLTVTVQTLAVKVEGVPPLRIDWYSRGISGDLCYMIITADDSGDDARVYYEYRPSITDNDMTDKVTSYICKILDAGIENPEITVGELMNL